MTINTSLATTAPAVLPTAGCTVAAAIGLEALGVYADGTEGGEASTPEFLVISGVIVVAAVLVLGLLVPRQLGSSKAGPVGLVLSLVGALFVPVFWAGLTPAFAVGGILLGLSARRTGIRPGVGAAAVAIGALAGLAYVAMFVGDWINTNGII